MLQELQKLLQEERLAGATLLILANKQDVAGALSPAGIQQVGLLSAAAAGLACWQSKAASLPLKPYKSGSGSAFRL